MGSLRTSTPDRRTLSFKPLAAACGPKLPSKTDKTSSNANTLNSAFTTPASSLEMSSSVLIKSSMVWSD